MDNYKFRLKLLYQIVELQHYCELNNILEGCAKENINDTILLSFYIRDYKFGCGLRQKGRHCFQWLMFNYPDIFINYIKYIPHYGRWDDLYELFPRKTQNINRDWIHQNHKKIDDDTYLKILNCQQESVGLFIKQLEEDHISAMENKYITTACKWALNEKSGRNKVYKYVSIMCDMWGINKREYRKRLVYLRCHKKIVEHYICNNDIRNINYNKLSKYNISKYTHIFFRKDNRRFMEFILYQRLKKDILNNPKLYPFDIIMRYNMYLENDLNKLLDNNIEYKWDEFLYETKKKGMLNNIMVIGDRSGSMYQQEYDGIFISNKLPINVSLSLSLLSSRCVSQPFNNMVLNFNEHPKFIYLRKDESLLESLYKITITNDSNRFNIYNILNLLLQTYIINNQIFDEFGIKKLVLISDKDILEADPDFVKNLNNINEKYLSNSLKIPDIIYINIVNSNVEFSTIDTNVCKVTLVKGFSYEIVDMLLSKGDIRPLDKLNDITTSFYFDKLINESS